jgi:hypothetical protein
LPSIPNTIEQFPRKLDGTEQTYHAVMRGGDKVPKGTSRYEHFPLDDRRRETRVLSLLPGGMDDTVNCTLDVMDLESQPTSSNVNSLSMLSHTLGTMKIQIVRL